MIGLVAVLGGVAGAKPLASQPLSATKRAAQLRGLSVKTPLAFWRDHSAATVESRAAAKTLMHYLRAQPQLEGQSPRGVPLADDQLVLLPNGALRILRSDHAWTIRPEEVGAIDPAAVARELVQKAKEVSQGKQLRTTAAKEPRGSGGFSAGDDLL